MPNPAFERDAYRRPSISLGASNVAEPNAK